MLFILPISILICYFFYKKLHGYRVFRFILFLPPIISVTVLVALFKYIIAANGPLGILYEIVIYNGILESPKVLNNIMLDSYGYAHPHSKSINFTTAQNYFLEGKAAMMPSGDWIEREMMENYTEDEINIAFMRMPIISSTTDKLATIKDEATLLAELIMWTERRMR